MYVHTKKGASEIYSVYTFIQLLHYGQDVRQGQFLSRVQLI